jgi:uncharacterized membrane protein YozB (DUF420 family)
MSRDRLGKNSALVVSIIYLSYPPLLLLNLNDFHLEAFASTFFLFSVYYLEREEWRKFSVFIILALSTLEFAPIIGVFVALYGLLLYVRKKFRNKKAAQKFIVLTAFASILMFLLAYTVKESFNSGTSPLPSPFHYILSNPAGMLNVIFSNWGAKMFYLISFFAPLAFLPLLAPEPLIMAFPWVLTSFASVYSPYYSVYFQYNGFIIPFVLAALPKAVERLRLQNSRRMLGIVLLATIFFALFLPFGPGAPWNYKVPIANDRTELIQQVLPLIPSNASVLTENDIFPHLSNRVNSYMYLPTSNATVDYILVDISSPFYDWLPGGGTLSGEEISPSTATQEALANGTYGVLASAKSILLLKKGYTGEPALFVPFVSKYNYKTLTLESGSTVKDPSSSSGVVLYHNETAPKGTFWFGPYATLPPGCYRVTYVIKVNGNEVKQSDEILSVDVSASSGSSVLTKTEVYGSNLPSVGQWFNITSLFTLGTPTSGLEFRGFVEGNCSVYLDYVMVEQLLPQPISKTSFDYENLFLDKGTASNGVMTHVQGQGTFWYGPNIFLPKGNYTAKFWLRLDRPYSGPLLDIDVSVNFGQKVLSSLTISASNFNGTNAWQSFEIKFTLQNDSNNVEFRGINVRESAPVSLLLVEVNPNTPD